MKLFPSEDTVKLVAVESVDDARKLAKYCIRHGYWFCHRHREGEHEFIIADANDLAKMEAAARVKLTLL